MPNIQNPNTAILWIGDDGIPLHTKTLDIGVWDMDTTPQITVAHGLGSNWQKIVNINVYILDDFGFGSYMLNWMDDAADPLLLAGGIGNITSTHIYLTRRTGGHFDSSTFGSGGGNRGFLQVIYKE